MMIMVIPIDITPVGILTEVKALQKEKAYGPDDRSSFFSYCNDNRNNDITNNCNTSGNTNGSQGIAATKGSFTFIIVTVL